MQFLRINEPMPAHLLHRQIKNIFEV